MEHNPGPQMQRAQQQRNCRRHKDSVKHRHNQWSAPHSHHQQLEVSERKVEGQSPGLCVTVPEMDNHKSN